MLLVVIVSTLDLWTAGLQLLAIGFVLGLLLGDMLDKIDPLSWKSVVQRAKRCRCQPEDFQIGDDVNVQ